MATTGVFSWLTSGHGRRAGPRRQRRLRRGLALLTAPAMAAWMSLTPMGAVAAGAGVIAVSAATTAGAGPARAATAGSVLILLQNGETSAPESADIPSGYTVTQVTPSAWAAMSASSFAQYSALVIGDPSSGSTCSATVPTTGTLGTSWQQAVSGNVAVLGTAPALAGSSGSDSLISDAVGYAAAGQGTGLYMSLNCGYSTAAAGTAVPLLAGVEGIGSTGGLDVTGQGASCGSGNSAGTVNTLEADEAAQFSGLASPALASPQWRSPACAVQETFSSWPASFTPLAYDGSPAAAGPANFTASDGAAGQPYVLLGAPVSAATAALAPSTGGEVPADAAAGGANPADPALAQAMAADPVNTENGDFTQSDTDASVPTFGPPLDFTRSYDAGLAQQQTRAGTPGPLGYGWADGWSAALTTAKPVPGDIYTLDGLATNNGQNGPAARAALDDPEVVQPDGANTYLADGNRVEEVAGSTGTQWGISMTAGDLYTIAGSASDQFGASGSGTAASHSLLDSPQGIAVSSGGLYIADTGNCRVVEVAAAAGTQWGISMAANDLYVIAGRTGGCGLGIDGKPATQSDLAQPAGLHLGAGSHVGDLYIADTDNNRIQEIAATAGTQWGQSMTAGDVYTVAGSATGAAGSSGDGGAAASGLLDSPGSVTITGSGDMYIADTVNCRVQEVPAAAGTQWGVSMTRYDMYTVAGRTGDCTIGNDNKAATSSDLWDPASVRDPDGNLYISDTGNNRVQEVAGSTHAEFGQSMTADEVYTIAGSASGAAGSSGDGGAATAALLDQPGSSWVDSSGDVFIPDAANSRIREVSASTADISAVAGDGFTPATAGDGGPATTAALANPDGTATDAKGNVYIADTDNNRIQEIAATSHAQWGIAMTAGDVYTIAGSALGTAGSSGDGGPAGAARLDFPIALAVDAAGDVYIADEASNRIQEVAAAGGTQRGIAMTAGDIYTVAGSAAGAAGLSGNGGAASSALLNMPWGIAVDTSGDVYIADENNNRIQEVAGSSGTQHGTSMTAGDIYTVAGSAAGTVGAAGDGGAAAASLLTAPTGVAIDAAGNLYITDDGNNRVQEVPPGTGPQRGRPMTAGDIYTIAGSAAGTSGTAGDGGPATAALLDEPIAIAVDAAGDLYVSDGNNDRIQEIAAASGTQWATSMTANDVYTIAGSATGAAGTAGDGGAAAAALLDFPIGIAVDPSGNAFLTDNASNRIREVTATAATALPQFPAPPGFTVSQGNGSQVTFYPQSGGSCAAPYVPAGQYCALPQYQGAALTYNAPTSTYTFTQSPGTTFTFGWNGALTGESDAAGDKLTVGYGTPAPGSGQCPPVAAACQTVTSASGRALVIGSGPGGLVTSVTDPMGRRWTYGYAGSDLTTVTDPMGNVTSYTYGAGPAGNASLASDLLTITGPNAQPGGPDAGDATVNAYDSLGRVISQTDPAGNKTTFSYCVSAADGDCLDTATGTGLVTVTDPDGNTAVDDYDQGALTAASDWTGSVLTSEQDSVPDLTAGGPSGGTLQDLVSSDGNGNLTRYGYDAAGNTIASMAPDGAGSQTATSTAQFTSLDDDSCDGTAQAATPCSASAPGPAPVAAGRVISPPSSAPPPGDSYNLYDTDGNQLYSAAGIYPPGSSTAAGLQTTYQLFTADSVTLGGTSISCAASPPSPSLPCAQINADGEVTQLGYDPAGDLTSSSAPGATTAQPSAASYGYDGDGEQTSQVAPDGNVTGANAGNYTTVTAYNADGEPTSVTQAGGSGATVTPRARRYGYDADGNPVTAQDGRGFTTMTAYNADDESSLVTNPAGDATLTCYDGDGNVTQTVPPAGVASSALSPASCPASYPSGYGRRLAADAATWTFDADGNTTAMTSPAPAGQTGPQSTTYAYDGDGNLITTTAPPDSNTAGAPDQVIADTYNSAGERATETTGSGTSAASTTSYCYDPDGDQTASVAPDGNAAGTAPCLTSSPWAVSPAADPAQAAYQTVSSYDSAGNLVATTSPATAAAPGGATTTYSYDDNGNKLTAVDPDGVSTTWTYTPAGLIGRISYSGSSAHSVSYSYDADGSQTAMSDATGSSSYGYDPFGELTSAQDGAGLLVGHSYDADGDTTGITYPLPATATWASTDTVSYGFSNADVLTSVTDFTGHQIAITPNADSLPAAQSLGSTADTITTSYDQAGTPSVISLKNATSTLQSFSYSDAPAGDILSETDTPTSARSPAAYSYDPQGRVVSQTPGTGPAVSYSYDASGNLTTLPTGATGRYDHDSELSSATLSGTTTSYAYNADGQWLAAQQGSATMASGSWNGASELAGYDDSAADMTAASYDGNGLRASTVTTAAGGAATQDFTWNLIPQSAQNPQLLMDAVNAYIYAGANTPAEQVSLSAGAVSYLTADSLGSVRGVVSPAGTLTASTSYDAWGNPQTAGGLASYTPFGYAGGYTDATGLLYLINRYYDPATGQFLSVDPEVLQTGQPYQYGADNPVSVADSTGLCPYLSSKPSQTRCRTDKILWRANSSLPTFQHYRDVVCGKSQGKCNNHGDSNGKWLDWSSDGCSHSPQNPDGFPFWKACERHDFGHRNYKEQGRCTNNWFKNKLNPNFYYDMKFGICSWRAAPAKRRCDDLANTYLLAVNLVGTC